MFMQNMKYATKNASESTVVTSDFLPDFAVMRARSHAKKLENASTARGRRSVPSSMKSADRAPSSPV